MGHRRRLPARRLRQLASMALAFALATLAARLAGAGWGTASGFGQIAFAAALVGVLLTDDPPDQLLRN
jgi:hypothetical protein